MFEKGLLFEELLEVWSSSKLVKLPFDFQANVNLGGIKYLQNVGFPDYLNTNISDMEFIIDFRDISKGLPRLSELDFGLPNPKEWSHYYVLGDETFCNGSSLWVYYIDTGETFRFDVELDDPFWETGTSIETLSLSFLTFYYWYRKLFKLSDSWEEQIRILDDLLLKADPKLYGSNRGFWYSMVKELQEASDEDDFRKNFFVSNMETKLKYEIF